MRSVKHFFPNVMALAACWGLGQSATGSEPTAAEQRQRRTVQMPMSAAPRVEHFEPLRNLGDDGPAIRAAGTERLVYSNTLGMTAVALGANRMVADDISLTCLADCRLTRLEIPVVGRVEPAGTGGPYSISIAIYDTCPYALDAAVRASRIIAGTSALVAIPDDAPRLITVDYPEVSVPTGFWLAVSFSRENVGPVFGAPPTLGFSEDVFDDPGFPCQAYFGGFPENSPAHTSFNLDLWASAATEVQVGYSYRGESGPRWTTVTGQWLLDDVHLRLESCRMVGYQVGVRGPGTYNFEFRPTCEGEPWAGTQKTQIVGQSSGQNPRVFHYSLGKPVDVPRHLWFAVKVNNTQGGPIAIGSAPSIGTTDDYFTKQMPGDACLDVVDTYYKGFHVAVFCEGPPPIGACCDPFLKECRGGDPGGPRCQTNADCASPGTCEAVCRDVAEYNCSLYFAEELYEPEWQEGDPCDPNPFLLPCGVSACCILDQECENLTENQCHEKQPLDAPREWQGGQFCDIDNQYCSLGICDEGDPYCSIGNCAAEWGGRGCNDFECGRSVCSFDPWCCDVEWDAACVLAHQTFRFCDVRPANDECYAYDFPRPRSAHLVLANSSTIFSNQHASQEEDGLGFACFEEPWFCQGGYRSGLPCQDDSDCRLYLEPAECVQEVNAGPDYEGFRPVWFRFEATDSTARVHTCSGRTSVRDTIVEAYDAEDRTFLETSCNTLVPLACSKESSSCADGLGSDIHLTELVPGREYFIKIAGNARSFGVPPEQFSGIIELTIQSPAPPAEVASTSPLPTLSIEDGSRGVLERGKGLNPSQAGHHERGHDPPALQVGSASSTPALVERNGYVSVQVNVDEFGNNILGDAANEPSIAINPIDPDQIVIGWRQFDSITSDFRQAGYAYSHDGGKTWTFPGVLEPGNFRSDPVLDSGPNGEIYFNSIDYYFVGTLFVSTDGGVSWNSFVGVGGDKPWFIVDKARGMGAGNVYGMTLHGLFQRWIPQTDDWDTVEAGPGVGTMAVGGNGSVYLLGGQVGISRNARLRDQIMSVPILIDPFGMYPAVQRGFDPYEFPNPGGLHWQGWVGTEPRGGNHPHNVYVVAFDGSLPFSRSIDGGFNWSNPVYVNDDGPNTDAWHWFGTMCVAPTGRIDVFWNDTRNTGNYRLSELYYSYSIDEGRTWSTNIPVSPVWDSHVGWPQQPKIGDYYHCVSDAHAANLAYAATFNGEQDVYFLRLEPDIDCNENGTIDRLEVMQPGVADCDGDWVPDECERDWDDDGLIDGCDEDMDGDGVSNEADVCFVNGVGAAVGPDGRPLADTNEDCFVDRVDYQRWARCTEADAPAACVPSFDLDHDGAISLADFAAFQRGFWVPRE